MSSLTPAHSKMVVRAVLARRFGRLEGVNPRLMEETIQEIIAAVLDALPPAIGNEPLLHGINCPALCGSDPSFVSPDGDPSCNCGLVWRRHLQTEQTMHGAWRKRAEEAEDELVAARGALAEVQAMLNEVRMNRETLPVLVAFWFSRLDDALARAHLADGGQKEGEERCHHHRLTKKCPYCAERP